MQTSVPVIDMGYGGKILQIMTTGWYFYCTRFVCYLMGVLHSGLIFMVTLEMSFFQMCPP